MAVDSERQLSLPQTLPPPLPGSSHLTQHTSSSLPEFPLPAYICNRRTRFPRAQVPDTFTMSKPNRNSLSAPLLDDRIISRTPSPTPRFQAAFAVLRDGCLMDLSRTLGSRLRLIVGLSRRPSFRSIQTSQRFPRRRLSSFNGTSGLPLTCHPASISTSESRPCPKTPLALSSGRS